MSVVVHPENDWVDYLTTDELYAIWAEEGDADTWADVRDGWPDEEIELFSPGTDSGTYDYFDEVILDGDQIEMRHYLKTTTLVVQGIQESRNAWPTSVTPTMQKTWTLLKSFRSKTVKAKW
ncbi:MAG: hypothetical protein U5K84_12500 [Alkalibacterium sp.]|nr:hypothetical protein [Alkalibacterium sp.]